MSTNDKPLAGLTVIENAENAAAQYCGRLLAVMGARVIKVEPPGGCSLRRDGPSLEKKSGQSAIFEYLNVNKLAVTCDLETSEGQAFFDQLLATADLLIDDTPRLSRSLRGLAPDVIRRKHANLVYLSVLPFGAEGEHADYAADELNLLHAGGEGYLMPNGLSLEMFPDRPPVKIHGHFANLIGGTTSVCAAMSALINVPTLGGQFVDVSVQDANISIGCMAIQRYGSGTLEHRHGRSFRYGGVIEAKDGYVELLVLEQHQWLALAKWMGNPDWIRPEFEDLMERGRCGDEINGHLRKWAKQYTVAELVQNGQAAKVPVAPYYDTVEVLETQKTNGRNAFCDVELTEGKKVPVFIAPFQFVDHPLDIFRGAPAVGADDVLIRATLAHPQQGRTQSGLGMPQMLGRRG